VQWVSDAEARKVEEIINSKLKLLQDAQENAERLKEIGDAQFVWRFQAHFSALPLIICKIEKLSQIEQKKGGSKKMVRTVRTSILINYQYADNNMLQSQGERAKARVIQIRPCRWHMLAYNEAKRPCCKYSRRKPSKQTRYVAQGLVFDSIEMQT